ncbi:LEAF RUST 10 DISEASE-RESISTANCE LOCUS RECEPTOR-LIKE PROTEIN KINASE-like 2.5 isoform X1 [Lolium rigidum]|uniref:LEAF RUST 10 DISEASE-RESISTANCE LOCUS RECEPTOR-LIKE PROTEIN KINASE-like 2.5 isoform X1 n=1 Tax=Lolium rigidum TaxID=89674 RepID=UPI001F5CCF4A|nr:LEAF RUST 10 DISEASE-RESISTANCE LOCUS RECEPTOR-LIKE PROTEIN KINASE-like 2.5 isoform X1 [Lolium rigidum]
MPPSCCWFFWAWWLPLILAVGAADQQVQGCSGLARRCGNLTISDPFWVVNSKTGRSCGSRDFVITCLNNIPLLPSTIPLSDGFQIMDISYEEDRMHVVDLDKMRLLPASNSCSERTWNISERLARRFRPDPMSLNLIMYNCTNASTTTVSAARRGGELVETMMRCGSESSEFVRIGGSYNASESYEGYYMEGCISSSLPVLWTSGKANASDYEQLISDGFVLRWDPPPPAASGSKRTGKKIILIVLTSASVALLIPCIYVLIWHRKGKRLWFLLCKKTSSSTERNYEAMIVSYGSLAPKRYTYSEVMKLTSSRSDQLGKGGYGVVFKGRLDDGRLVAVKFLHECKGNGDDFVNEVMSIGRTSHVNIVNLFGFCLEGSKRALIYEYMPNGSLDKYIYSENPKEILGWERLYAIAIGIARGLEYLHHSCNTRIVHFDIKPQNILLDKDFSPKIADFGLAKLSHAKESQLSMTGARGTIGYIAPEVHSRAFGVASTKSDVYSYGMMLLEMVGGRKNVNAMAEKSSEQYFPDWIYDHFAQDDRLPECDVTSEIDEKARKMTFIGLWCIQILPIYRPTIAKVLEMFERSLDEMKMPPKQNFSEPIEDPPHNMSAQSASSTTREEISFASSENLQYLPSL